MVFEHRRPGGEPDERRAKQADTDVTQPTVRNEAEQPDQRETFEGPAKRDPFPIELNREDESDEEQRGPALPRKPRITGGGIRLALPDEKPNGDRVRHHENRGRKTILHPGKCLRDRVVDQGELERPRERTNRPRQRLRSFRGEKWKGEENQKERHLPAERERGVIDVEIRSALPFALDEPAEDQR